MRISRSKSVVLLKMAGKRAKDMWRRHVVYVRDRGHCLRLKHQNLVDLAIRPHHVYLGTVLSYGPFEKLTLEHRMRIAAGAFSRLRPLLKCKALAVNWRVQLWRSCIFSTCYYGLDSVGLLPCGARAYRSKMHMYARCAIGDHSYITGRTTAEVLAQHHIPDPVKYIQERQERRLSSHTHSCTEHVSQRRRTVNDSLKEHADAETMIRSQSSILKNVTGEHALAKSFACPECGVHYATQPAMRQHYAKAHLSKAEIKENQREVLQGAKLYASEHAREGMPWCRYCDKKFDDWRTFTLHINTSSCQEYRDAQDTCVQREENEQKCHDAPGQTVA